MTWAPKFRSGMADADGIHTVGWRRPFYSFATLSSSPSFVMARLNSEEETDSRKTTTAKKNAAAKKKDNSSSGIWPCTLGNGCTKQFAREADLKRHQRTSKLHVMAGFACPQCEATFTRTDALKRHQKTRHNGVFDTVDVEEVQETQSNAEASSSRDAMVVPETIQGRPSASGPATGHSSYYRGQNVPSASFSQRGRRIESSEWTNGHAWPNGNPPPPPGRSTYMYVSPTYYRHGNGSSARTRRPSISPPPHEHRHSRSDHPSSPSSTSSHSRHGESNSPPPSKSPLPVPPAPIPPLPPPVQLERLLLEANAARTHSSEDECTQLSFESAIKPDRRWVEPDIDVNVTVREVDPVGTTTTRRRSLVTLQY
ncbi:hypothetical protein D9757_008800 [Collybiopsis confluens]|uniref:C2H2-type domain-containing protein n=1 Tax=Collybiopsis confluens TaxID=2823264 RepID=A0A8H5M190_9AGAR|nr:hypothetical protein D9757_008800 [Collybiopsis confluens]